MKNLVTLVLQYPSAQIARFSSPSSSSESPLTVSEVAGDTNLSLAHIRWPVLREVQLDLALGPAAMVDVLARLPCATRVKIAADAAGGGIGDDPQSHHHSAIAFPTCPAKKRSRPRLPVPVPVPTRDIERATNKPADAADDDGRQRCAEKGAEIDQGAVDNGVDSGEAAASAVTELVLTALPPYRHLLALLSWVPRVALLRVAVSLDAALRGDGAHVVDRRLQELAAALPARLRHVRCIELVGAGYEYEPLPTTLAALRELGKALATRVTWDVPVGAHASICTVLNGGR
jgi:hypothetical protein